MRNTIIEKINELNDYNKNSLEILFRQDKKYSVCLNKIMENKEKLLKNYNTCNRIVGVFLYKVQENLDKKRNYEELEQAIINNQKNDNKLKEILENLTFEKVYPQDLKNMRTVIQENKTKDFLNFWRESGFWRIDSCLFHYVDTRIGREKGEWN